MKKTREKIVRRVTIEIPAKVKSIGDLIKWLQEMIKKKKKGIVYTTVSYPKRWEKQLSQKEKDKIIKDNKKYYEEQEVLTRSKIREEILLELTKEFREEILLELTKEFIEEVKSELRKELKE